MSTVCFSKTPALTYKTTNRQNPKHQNHGKPSPQHQITKEKPKKEERFEERKCYHSDLAIQAQISSFIYKARNLCCFSRSCVTTDKHNLVAVD
jgi:hypothetical protein